mmetsp:Transcript_29039/g.52894  ORF Transcript_29039/g.52894 Transcript_29039/m.52894 type:complete len:108 (-) Transcript_29039:21-344(-)
MVGTDTASTDTMCQAGLLVLLEYRSHPNVLPSLSTFPGAGSLLRQRLHHALKNHAVPMQVVQSLSNVVCYRTGIRDIRLLLWLLMPGPSHRSAWPAEESTTAVLGLH